MKKLLVLFIMLIKVNVMAEDNLLVVLNEGKVGDQNQLHGIVAELAKAKVKWSTGYLKNTQISELEVLADNACKTSHPLVILTSGPDGIDVIDKISNKLCSSVLVVNSAHMLFKSHLKILEYTNILALPSYSLDKEFEHKADKAGTKIVQTLGVAHNITPQKIEEEYTKFKDQFSWLEDTRKIAMIVLGGDAPDADGKIHYYTTDEAVKTAKYIGDFCKASGYKLMIFNGPRTGTYNPTTGEKDANAHTGEKLDNVTQSFMAEIANHLKSDQYKLYNFNKDSASPYKAGFRIVKNAEEGKCFLPGESTSMISEANDYLASSTVIINNNAMNDSHHKHAILEAQAAKAILLGTDLQEIKVKVDSKLSKKAAKSNVALIAEQIAEDYENLAKNKKD